MDLQSGSGGRHTHAQCLTTITSKCQVQVIGATGPGAESGGPGEFQEEVHLGWPLKEAEVQLNEKLHIPSQDGPRKDVLALCPHRMVRAEQLGWTEASFMLQRS